MSGLTDLSTCSVVCLVWGNSSWVYGIWSVEVLGCWESSPFHAWSVTCLCKKSMSPKTSVLKGEIPVVDWMIYWTSKTRRSRGWSLSEQWGGKDITVMQCFWQNWRVSLQVWESWLSKIKSTGLFSEAWTLFWKYSKNSKKFSAIIHPLLFAVPPLPVDALFKEWGLKLTRDKKSCKSFES